MLSVIFGFLSGVVSGMGIGGGAILVPFLILFEGIPQHTAQGINLAYFIPTAVIAIYVHVKEKRVDMKTAAVIGLSGMLSSLCFSLIVSHINNGILQKMFGFFLLFVGIYEVYKGIRLKS